MFAVRNPAEARSGRGEEEKAAGGKHPRGGFGCESENRWYMKYMAIRYKFTPTVIQNRTALRVPTEAPAKADLRNKFRFCRGWFGNPSKLDCARLRPQLGVGPICKRGFVVSDTTDGNVNTFVNPIR